MNYLKKLGLFAAAIVFCLSLSVITADAQRRNRSWNSGNYNNGSWQNRSRQNRNWRASRVTPQEYRRLQRQRIRLYNTRNRYYNNDGYISSKERRKLQKRYLKYRRNAIRDRRDW